MYFIMPFESGFHFIQIINIIIKIKIKKKRKRNNFIIEHIIVNVINYNKRMINKQDNNNLINNFS